MQHWIKILSKGRTLFKISKRIPTILYLRQAITPLIIKTNLYTCSFARMIFCVYQDWCISRLMYYSDCLKQCHCSMFLCLIIDTRIFTSALSDQISSMTVRLAFCDISGIKDRTNRYI